uniref:Ubiquitin-like protease family profile domain-containing protein n=1 Tax=Oryza punctata TaxID=4537 RepID=A0A0E0L264_ORYPU
MGFEGLLHMPLIANHRDFSYWLLSRVSLTRSAIELESGDFLPLSPEDVKKVLGIPCVGEELQAPNSEVVSHVKRLIAERMKVASFRDVNKEVHYLDNVDFGDLNLKHNKFPRIALYDRDTIKERYQLDISVSSYYQATQFEKLKLRPKNDACYKRMCERTRVTDSGGNENVQIESQHAAELIQKAQELKSFWISCIGNLDKAAESLLKVTEASKYMPITNEVNVSEGYKCTAVNDDADNGTEVNQTPSVGKDVEDASAAAANCTPMVHTDDLTEKSIDLNRTVPHRIYTGLDFDPPSFDLNIDFSPSKNTDTPVSPHSISRDVAAASLDHLQAIYIENSKGEIKQEHCKKRELPEPRVLQFDGNYGIQSWKMATASPFDIMPDKVRTSSGGGLAAIAGNEWWSPNFFREQFIGNSVKYDVSKCAIIFVPMCEMSHWKCYAFKLHERVVQILDPKKSVHGNDTHAENNHQWNGPILAKAMQECLSMFFQDWTDDVTKWEQTEPNVPSMHFGVDSGINTLEYMKYWNGFKYVGGLNPVSIDNIRADIDIMAMKANVATLPNIVQQLMKQYNSAVSE